MIKLYIQEDNERPVRYRIDYYGSWDNGHVLHSFKKDTLANAEQDAKHMSLKDENNLYYVVLDNIMNPTTDWYWYRGKQYHYINDADLIDNIKREINNNKY